MIARLDKVRLQLRVTDREVIAEIRRTYCALLRRSLWRLTRLSRPFSVRLAQLVFEGVSPPREGVLAAILRTLGAIELMQTSR